MEWKDKFFATEQCQGAIKKFLGNISSASQSSDFEKTRNNHMQMILNVMIREADLWDKNCAVSIAAVGNVFIGRLSSEQDYANKEKMDNLFVICYRFLFELYLTMKNEFSMEFEDARRFAVDNLNEFSPDAKMRLEYTIRELPIAILKALISHENIESIKEFNKASEKSVKMRDEWNRDLDERAAKVTALKENLDRYKAAFNFVGLHQGFDDLVTSKTTEKNRILIFLIIFGILTISPITAEVIYIYKSGKSLSDFKDVFLVALVPTISLVALLIYFFRILLFNFNALKSQILQLELRKTLCRFIQNYVEYSTLIKQKDKDSLAKFENIVFSGIVSDETKLPSTFDGVEQIANLIKSIKG